MVEYIENLKSTIEGVPPENIFNFDETNLTDNRSRQDTHMEITDEDEQISEKSDAGVSNGIFDKSVMCFSSLTKQIGSDVVVLYESCLYPRIITSLDEKAATLSAMKKSKKSWKWPERKDEVFYKWEDVLGGIKPPLLQSIKGDVVRFRN